MGTPLGRPVEPEVWMTYARSSGPVGPVRSASVRSAVGRTARSSWVAGSPRTTVGAGIAGSAPAVAASVTRTAGGASSVTRRSRSAGCPVSSGRYPAPVFSTASSATTRRIPRGSASATSRPGPAPRSTSSRANRFASALSSA